MPRPSLATAASILLTALVLPPAWFALEQVPAVLLPTGQTLSPLAPPGARLQALNPHLADAPDYTAGQAVTSVLGPDHRTLLVLTSGYNEWHFTSGPNAGKRNPADSNEYVFVYDVAARAPEQKQVMEVPNTYSGIAFSPDGNAFYVAGGMNDNVHSYARANGAWAEEGAPVALGHVHGLGVNTKPEAAGLAVSADGNTLLVANYENDSVSILSRVNQGWRKATELDLRPGRGVAGGSYPYWIAVKGNDTAYISSVRDREIDVVRLGSVPAVTARVKLAGQPSRILLDAGQSRLYVAEESTDAVAVVSTATNQIVSQFSVVAPPSIYPDPTGLRGASPNSLALAPDGRTLYVTDGGENAVAVVTLEPSPTVTALIPTAWYPNSVTPGADGAFLYVVNGKSDSPPNPHHGHGLTPALATAVHAANESTLQSDKAALQSFPAPTPRQLAALTAEVIANDHLLRQPSPAEIGVMDTLHRNIHHIIYIIKENRTYDQVLGDLPTANGDAAITEFPEANTPNFHALARNFVALDSFYCSGEVSGDGWPWSTSGRTTDVVEKEVPPNYASRGLTYDTEGTNRNLNLGLATVAARREANAASDDDDDDLPGDANVAAPDGAGQGAGAAGSGYLWNAVLRRHLTLRNYGFWVDDARYNPRAPDAMPELTNPAASHTVVGIATSAVLAPVTDPYFRGFDQTMPDYFRYKEWEREFDQYAAGGDLPNLELVRLAHDHFGNFGAALDGLNTPEMQIADNDYAVGMLIEKVAHSRFKDDTLIFVVEDDAQDGGDHVDAHRSPAFIIGPYVRHLATVSTAYNTVSLLRTMEDILGTGPLNLNDAAATPMFDVFNLEQKAWDYRAVPSQLLRNSQLPIVFGPTSGPAPQPTHDGAYWEAKTAGMDFSREDHLDSAKFNQLLWTGIMGAQPYPKRP